MKIAVTGANGHVGVNLCKALKDRGHQVRALTHKNDYALKHIDVELVKGDVFDLESIRSFLSGSDIVFHLAARISIGGDPGGMVHKINAEGTRNIVDTCKLLGIPRLIHFSSIHAFKQLGKENELDETHPLVETGAFSYDRSKAEGERIVMAAAKDGLDALVLSPTAIIGPMDFEPGLIGKAVLQLYHHQIPALVPGGYNWVDVRDVVQGAIASIERGRRGEKYLLSGEWRSLSELSAIIEKSSGRRIVKTIMPFWAAWVGLPFITLFSRITGLEPLYTRESLVIIEHGTRQISNGKARKELGFNPRPLEETVVDLVNWFRDNNMLEIKPKKA